MCRRRRLPGASIRGLAWPLATALGWVVLTGAAGAQAPSPPPVHAQPAGSVPAQLESLVPENTQSAEAKADAPATLFYWNRPIVTFRARVGSLDPEARIALALQRLTAMSERTLRATVGSHLGRLDDVDVALITVGDQTAFSFLEADLDPLSGKSLEEATAEVVANLRDALAARTEQRRLPVLLRGLGEALAASLVVGVLLALVRRFRRWWAATIVRGRTRLDRIHLLEIDVGQSLRRFVRRGVHLLLWVVDAGILYLWLTFVLSRFPYTEPWGDALGGWLSGTLRSFALVIVRAVPSLATIVLILLLARAFVGLVRGLLARVEEGSLELSWLSPEVARGARRIVVLAIWLFTLAIVYPLIPGSSSGAFQSVSVLVGLMFSVASAGFINHVMAGWVILFSRTVRVGDYVRVGNVEGTVLQLGVLSIKILDHRHEEVVLPNAVVTGTTTTNFSRHAAAGGSLASTTLTIGYDAPWRQVHAMLLLAAERTPGVHATPAPRVLQRALSDFYVEYELVVETELKDRPRIVSELHANIQDEFNRHGVQIMSPHFRGQPAAPVVVPEAHWYAPPALSDEERRQRDRAAEREEPSAAAVNGGAEDVPEAPERSRE